MIMCVTLMMMGSRHTNHFTTISRYFNLEDKANFATKCVEYEDCGQLDFEQSNKTFSINEGKLIIKTCCRCSYPAKSLH